MYIIQSKIKSKTKGKGQVHNMINFQMVIAFQEIRRGHQAIVNFTNLMNMPPPLSKSAFQSINEYIHKIYEQAALESTTKAANETRTLISEDKQLSNDVVDCNVSGDATWKKRGHTKTVW